MNNNIPWEQDPEQTGRGVYCAPGPVAEQAPIWVLKYDDKDRRDVIMFDNEQARATFAKAEALGWNCYLLETARRKNGPPKTVPDGFMDAVTALVDRLPVGVGLQTWFAADELKSVRDYLTDIGTQDGKQNS